MSSTTCAHPDYAALKCAASLLTGSDARKVRRVLDDMESNKAKPQEITTAIGLARGVWSRAKAKSRNTAKSR